MSEDLTTLIIKRRMRAIRQHLFAMHITYRPQWGY